jgi:hypothetical protein
MPIMIERRAESIIKEFRQRCMDDVPGPENRLFDHSWWQADEELVHEV